jgi:hypothetical protein
LGVGRPGIAKQGSKLHVVGDAGGLPILVVLSAANARDATMFKAVLDDIRAHWGWLGGWRRLRIRSERSSERFYVLVLVACAVICSGHDSRQPSAGLWRVWADITMIGEARGGRWRGPRTSTASMRV